MFAVRLLACVAAMPLLAEAEVFGFWGCHDFLDSIDRIGQTYGGAMELMSLLEQDPLVIMWNPNNWEVDNTCLKLTRRADGMFRVQYFTLDGELIQHVGKMGYSTYPTAVFEMTPVDPENGDPDTDDRLPEGILSANRYGVAKMFPLYISETEAIVLNCLNTIFGHVMSVYVLSTQDLSQVDSECGTQTVTDAIGIRVTSTGNMTACQERHNSLFG